MKKDEIQKLVNTGLTSLNEALASGYSTRLKEVMAVMARFPRYSFHNCLLIFLQRPTATRVQGFHAWRKMGRSVKKGESGIGIMAPLAYRTNEDEEREIRGFRVVHVFDIDQTEGDELPRLPAPTGDANSWLPRVEQLIASRGIELEYRPVGCGAAGISRMKSITLQPDLEPAKRLQVLVHEFAHELLHPDIETRKRLSVAQKETEAEAVSYIVCEGLGMDCRETSSDYILLHDGDVDLFSQSMRRIQKCSADILLGLFDPMAESDSLSDADKTAADITRAA